MSVICLSTRICPNPVRVTIVPWPIYTFQTLPNPKHDSLSCPEISTAEKKVDMGGGVGWTGRWCKGNWSLSNNCTLGMRIHSILSYHCCQPIKESCVRSAPTTPPFLCKLIPRRPQCGAHIALDWMPVTLNIEPHSTDGFLHYKGRLEWMT